MVFVLDVFTPWKTPLIGEVFEDEVGLLLVVEELVSESPLTVVPPPLPFSTGVEVVGGVEDEEAPYCS